MTLTTYTSAAATDKAALQRIIKGMKEAGWNPVRIYDGEESTALPSVIGVSRLADMLMATDDVILFWRKDRMKGTMFFVFGNSPWEVMADCSVDNGVWDADLKAVEAAINLEGV